MEIKIPAKTLKKLLSRVSGLKYTGMELPPKGALLEINGNTISCSTTNLDTTVRSSERLEVPLESQKWLFSLDRVLPLVPFLDSEDGSVTLKSTKDILTLKAGRQIFRIPILDPDGTLLTKEKTQSKLITFTGLTEVFIAALRATAPIAYTPDAKHALDCVQIGKKFVATDRRRFHIYDLGGDVNVLIPGAHAEVLAGKVKDAEAIQINDAGGNSYAAVAAFEDGSTYSFCWKRVEKGLPDFQRNIPKYQGWAKLEISTEELKRASEAIIAATASQETKLVIVNHDGTDLTFTSREQSGVNSEIRCAAPGSIGKSFLLNPAYVLRVTENCGATVSLYSDPNQLPIIFESGPFFAMLAPGTTAPDTSAKQEGGAK